MKNILYLALILMVFPLTSFSQGFYTDGGELMDANGNEFIMKGINIPLTWFRNDVQGSIDDIRINTGSNCVRIVLETNTPDLVWQNAVQTAIDNDMIPMVELHSVTGSTSSAELQNMASWWASSSRADFLKQPNIAKYVLINIANEWGRYETALADAQDPNGGQWLDAFTQAIQTIRNAGITTTLVVDAVGFGQDIQTAKNIRDDAQTMMNSDSTYLSGEANLLFSIHMYCEWSVGKDNPAIVNTIKNSGIPIIVGEFGLQHDETGGVCDIDEVDIMSECQNAGVGWLAWSQKGNNSPLGYLDVCNDWACSSLSGWGNTIVNGANGTKTSVTASVFTGQAACPIPNLGDDMVICNGETLTLDGSITNNGSIFSWKKDGVSIGSSSGTLNIDEIGVYELSVQTTGCSLAIDEIVVISGNLDVLGDEICLPGIASLEVSGGIGPYNWFETISSSMELNQGLTYSPSITQTTSYFVEDIGSQPVTVSLSSIGKTNQGTGTVWNIDDFATTDKQVVITVTEEVTLDAVSVYPLNNNTDVTIRVTQNSIVVGENTLVGLNSGKRRIPLDITLEPGQYLMDAVGTTDKLGYESDGAVFPYSSTGIISFTGAEPWVISGNRYGSFYEWELSQTTGGSFCDRTEVIALINPNSSECIVGGINNNENKSYEVFPNPTSGSVRINEEFNGEWVLYDLIGSILKTGMESSIDLSNLPVGIYHLVLNGEVYRIVKN